jgi:hypothetical protein
VRVVRNIAIIAALAFVVAAVPGGGNAATAIVTALSIAFLAVIALVGYQIYRSQKLSILSLTDGQRAILCGAVGVVVLMIAGADEMLETGLGALVWIGLLAVAAVAVWRLWVETQTY